MLTTAEFVRLRDILIFLREFYYKMWKHNNSEEIKLQLAEMESYNTGKITPLLKEELRYYIQTRRLSEGKNELVIDFKTDFKKNRKLRPDEVAKLERRREQNRKASEKFRVKKRTELQNLQHIIMPRIKAEKRDTDSGSSQLADRKGRMLQSSDTVPLDTQLLTY